MVSIGIDSGSTTTKGVVFDGEQIIKKVIVLTGVNPRKTIEKMYDDLYQEGAFVVTTGYGRKLLTYADKEITEITCHAKGALFIDCDVRTIIDIGGQDSKVIRINDNSQVIDFLMNDKCAAGTGRFIEMMTRILQQDLEGLDAYMNQAEPVKISSMCAVFAESEIISLLAHDIKGESIAKGVIHAIGQRTAHFAMRVPIEEKIFFSGGLSNLETLKKAISSHLGQPLFSHEDAQFVGAIGAAVIGYENLMKQSNND